MQFIFLRAGEGRNASGGIQLQAANGSSIRTFGERSVQLDLGLAKSFTWKFTIAEVTKPIIGADFLRNFGLLVDVGRKRLMDAETFLTIPGSYRRSAVSKLCVLVQIDQYSDILPATRESGASHRHALRTFRDHTPPSHWRKSLECWTSTDDSCLRLPPSWILCTIWWTWNTMNSRQHGQLFTKITFNAVNRHWPRQQASRIHQRQQRPASTQMRQIWQWVQCYNSVYTEFGRPYRFFSRKLLPAEKKYSTFDKEHLAIYLAVKKFRYFVEGRKFAIFTDHKPLTFVFNKVSGKWSPRQQRHLCFVSLFTTDIRYVPGPDNVVAYALSRAPPQESGTVASMDDGVVTEVIDYAAMARQQATYTGVQRRVVESNLQIARCESYQALTSSWSSICPLESPVHCSLLHGHAEFSISITIWHALEPELCADKFVIASSGMECPET